MTVSDKWSMQVVCHSSRQFGPITVLTNIEGPVSVSRPDMHPSSLYVTTFVPYDQLLAMYVRISEADALVLELIGHIDQLI